MYREASSSPGACRSVHANGRYGTEACEGAGPWALWKRRPGNEQGMVGSTARFAKCTLKPKSKFPEDPTEHDPAIQLSSNQYAIARSQAVGDQKTPPRTPSLVKSATWLWAQGPGETFLEEWKL